MGGSKAVMLEQGEWPAEQMCTHRESGECNGCPLMGIRYAEQLAAKGKMLSEIFGFEVPVEPARKRLGYRNKAELSYINGKLGYREKGDFHRSFALRECLLMSAEANAEILKISKALGEKGICSADIMKRKSGLGYVVYRENRQHEGLANFVFFGEVQEGFAEVCRGILGGNLVGAAVSINRTWSDAGSGEALEVFGAECIEEEMLGMKFRIGFGTFFQANVESAEKIFAMTAERVPAGSKVLDIYCGVGAISLAVAGRCERVVGIELDRGSVSAAMQNAELNGIRNAWFACGSAGEKLREVGGFDVVVCDPPRSGLGKKIAEAVTMQEPQRALYISCNPKALADDLKHMHGYRISEIRAFDQFPHTRHVEMLCMLEKK